MDTQLFHIFRNTPLGRETLLQSIYFCNMTGAFLVIYIPEYTKFLMYFDNDVVQIDLDNSYLTSPETARKHINELTSAGNLDPGILKPKNFTASVLPDIPVDFDYMSCPRSISDMSSKIGLGFIGSKVRRIIKSAEFPVLITSPVFKEWKSIAVFFGGSNNAVNALRLGVSLSRRTGLPMEVFTQVEGRNTENLNALIEKENLRGDMDKYLKKWHLFESGKFQENIYAVPHDALVLMGAYGHGVIRDIMFGSKMETIQSTLSNNMLIVGPNYVSK